MEARLERRIEARVPIALGAELWIRGETYRARIRNLSSTGAYVEIAESERPLPPTRAAWLYATGLGESTEAEVRYAHVVDGHMRGAGLRLRDVSANLRRRIRSLVDAEGAR